MAREIRIEEQAQVPLDGAVFGWLAMVPIWLLALTVCLQGEMQGLALRGLVLWSAGIVMFLAGVRRGLSFRTPGGPRVGQLAVMLGMFGAGLLALILPEAIGLALLALCYAIYAVLDPRAARRQEVPLYFIRLRPWQMGSACLALGGAWLALVL
ncbi:DUF3429 domain-containing protein [Thioclava sp. GXIMD4216]|uniref:DUF3429 domain-containing protein n=1 Tax=Thioclava sp. GXIMD4216 TaxID=3131929 RepID=UPI0030CB081D